MCTGRTAEVALMHSGNTHPDQLDQPEALLLQQPLPPLLRVLGRRVLGFDRQGRDAAHGRRGAELHGHGRRLWAGQVAHLAHGGGRVVEVGAELAHPLWEKGGRERQTLRYPSVFV